MFFHDKKYCLEKKLNEMNGMLNRQKINGSVDVKKEN